MFGEGSIGCIEPNPFNHGCGEGYHTLLPPSMTMFWPVM